MYTAYVLTDKSRKEILEKFPVAYSNVVCHHITEKFGVGSDEPIPAPPASVKVVGHVDSKTGIEGLLVEINGSTKRPDGKLYHITLSLGQGRKPVETNDVINRAVSCEPFDVDVTPKLLK